MFNFQRHVCPNLRKNTCISRENSWVYKPYVHASYWYLRLCRIPKMNRFSGFPSICCDLCVFLWDFVEFHRHSSSFAAISRCSQIFGTSRGWETAVSSGRCWKKWELAVLPRREREKSMQFHQRESGICSHPSQNSDSRRRRVEKTKRPPVKLQKYASERVSGP